MLMGIIGWILIGLIVGLIGSKMAKLNGDDPLLGIGLGVAGAVIGGALFSMISRSTISGFNVWSMLAAIVGAAAAVVAWHVVRGRATPVEYHNRRYH